MEQLTQVSTYRIDGYTNQQIDFTLDELTKGTDVLTLQIFLYKKFGLLDSQADDLIAKVQKASGIRSIEHFSSSENDFLTNLKSKGVSEHDAKQVLKQAKEKTNQDNASAASGSVIWGIVLLAIGLCVTVLSQGHVIAYGAILVGGIRIFAGLMHSDSN